MPSLQFHGNQHPSKYISLLAVALATGHAYVAYDPRKEEPGDELGDPSIWGYEEKVTLIPKRSAAGDTTDANEEVEYEEHITYSKRGVQVGWEEFRRRASLTPKLPWQW